MNSYKNTTRNISFLPTTHTHTLLCDFCGTRFDGGFFSPSFFFLFSFLVFSLPFLVSASLKQKQNRHRSLLLIIELCQQCGREGGKETQGPKGEAPELQHSVTALTTNGLLRRVWRKLGEHGNGRYNNGYSIEVKRASDEIETLLGMTNGHSPARFELLSLPPPPPRPAPPRPAS